MSLTAEYTLNFKSKSQIFEDENQIYSVFLAIPLPVKQDKKSGNFFKGNVKNPLLFRDLLLFLSDIVNSRFYRPDLWRLMDPVVTCEKDLIRLECFSSCASIYGRVDFNSDMFDGYELSERGTTNVNFNNDFTKNLSLLRPEKKSVFEIGQDFLSLETEHGKTVEQKVKLPERWLKGFLQSQAIHRKATKFFELGTISGKKFISEIKESMGDSPVFLLQSGKNLQIMQSKPRNGLYIEVSGINRLKLLKKLIPHILNIEIFEVKETGLTVWVIKTQNASITVGLSSSVKNGFSGEGEALRNLTLKDDSYTTDLAHHIIKNLNNFKIKELSDLLEISEGEALKTVDLLSMQGLLGYDCSSGVYFYRVLPFSGKTNTRWVNSKEILENNQIEVEKVIKDENGLFAKGWVQGNKARYYVEINVLINGYLNQAKCNCEWIVKHELKRGPCKHILALRFYCEESHG